MRREWNDMPPMAHVAALVLAATLLAGCSHSPMAERSSAPTTLPSPGESASVSEAATVPSSLLATTAPTAPVTSLANAGTTAPSSPARDRVVLGAGDVASGFVEALIAHVAPPTVPRQALWENALAGGTVIQVTTLAEGAGRAEVAVSIAFTDDSATAAAEPIGVRVQLHDDSTTGWTVDAIGYLA